MIAMVFGEEVNVADGDVAIDLWHKKLGNMSLKGLEVLARKNIVPEIRGMHLETCVENTRRPFSKQHRVVFQHLPRKRKSQPLELVHSDLCYMKDKTPGRALYFATFIADFSRKLWCSALKTKYQVIEIFKIFHVSVERETGRKLNCI